MLTRKQMRRRIRREKLIILVDNYNKIYQNSYITHARMAEMLDVNITTFLRWRKIKAVPNDMELNKFEDKLNKIKGLKK